MGACPSNGNEHAETGNGRIRHGKDAYEIVRDLECGGAAESTSLKLMRNKQTKGMPVSTLQPSGHAALIHGDHCTNLHELDSPRMVSSIHVCIDSLPMNMVLHAEATAMRSRPQVDVSPELHSGFCRYVACLCNPACMS